MAKAARYPDKLDLIFGRRINMNRNTAFLPSTPTVDTTGMTSCRIILSVISYTRLRATFGFVDILKVRVHSGWLLFAAPIAIEYWHLLYKIYKYFFFFNDTLCLGSSNDHCITLSTYDKFCLKKKHLFIYTFPFVGHTLWRYGDKDILNYTFHLFPCKDILLP